MNRIDAIHIRGFRSLADVELTGLPDTTVLIGANGSGKSNFIRFFEMVSWMLRARRLGEFVASTAAPTISFLVVAAAQTAWRPSCPWTRMLAETTIASCLPMRIRIGSSLH